MKCTFVAVFATMAAMASAQDVTISLPSGVSIPSGVTLPSGVAVVTATSTSTAQANANFNKRFNRRQNFSISGISGLSIGLQQTSTSSTRPTAPANAADAN